MDVVQACSRRSSSIKQCDWHSPHACSLEVSYASECRAAMHAQPECPPCQLAPLLALLQWQTSPMNPNRQASTNAEDGQVQPATAAGWAATGKPGGGKAAAGRGRPAAAKAPTPKAQAAKTQGQGGRAGRQPQGPAAALLDAERRRAAQHSAPTPRK